MEYDNLSIEELDKELDRRDEARRAGNAYNREETKRIMAVRNAKIRERERIARDDARLLVEDGLKARAERQRVRAEAVTLGAKVDDAKGGK